MLGGLIEGVVIKVLVLWLGTPLYSSHTPSSGLFTPLIPLAQAFLYSSHTPSSGLFTPLIPLAQASLLLSYP